MNLEKVAWGSVIFVGTVAAFTIGGVFQSFSDGYFLGRARKKGVTYKNIATRNAVLGGVVGAVSAVAVVTAKPKEQEKAIAGIGSINVY